MRQISSKGIILEHKILLSVRWTRTIFMKEEPTACEWTVAGCTKGGNGVVASWIRKCSSWVNSFLGRGYFIFQGCFSLWPGHFEEMVKKQTSLTKSRTKVYSKVHLVRLRIDQFYMSKNVVHVH